MFLKLYAELVAALLHHKKSLLKTIRSCATHNSKYKAEIFVEISYAAQQRYGPNRQHIGNSSDSQPKHFHRWPGCSLLSSFGWYNYDVRNHMVRDFPRTLNLANAGTRWLEYQKEPILYIWSLHSFVSRWKPMSMTARSKRMTKKSMSISFKSCGSLWQCQRNLTKQYHWWRSQSRWSQRQYCYHRVRVHRKPYSWQLLPRLVCRFHAQPATNVITQMA